MSPRGTEQNEAMRAETMARITPAALTVFADPGYFGTTMKRITEVSGLSYGLVYRYFPSKEEVFRHLIDSSFDASQHAMDAVLSEPGTDWKKIERLSSFISIYFQYQPGY
jgi:AcrR family transcriptional regulator